MMLSFGSLAGFALLYSFGNITALASTLFLMGPGMLIRLIAYDIDVVDQRLPTGGWGSRGGLNFVKYTLE